MTDYVLEFEKPIIELEKRIKGMKELSENESVGLSEEIGRLEEKASKLREEIYSKLTRWQRVLLARHPQRPYTRDYIEYMTDSFFEIHGDRAFGDDPAIVGGIARIGSRKVVIIGQQKGRTTKQKLHRNFGMMHPEGYRKALRIMNLAAKFKRPIISLIDTPGAFPGIGAEERGQAEAIARNLLEMSHLPVPIIIAVIGEGASGGALGIGIGDRILMLENTWYSVISPEGCAAILWHDSTKAEQAAEALKPTAPDLLELGVIDKVVREPIGGAHQNYDEAAKLLRESIEVELTELEKLSPEQLVDARIEKYSNMGFYEE
ncbi:acetyl-CoA carboxylase carboxyltransferase subunit alpha [candidate division KSB1 bacterium]|nr:acetyl-CoA carboxylase carboxyltransferase subunit alpha [candidate division KSB1 bacterium]MCH7754118.1 acetyl-CoA carboxylase carboxyltransferase subunit alpha [candidate division KSB1 bacterium]